MRKWDSELLAIANMGGPMGGGLWKSLACVWSHYVAVGYLCGLLSEGESIAGDDPGSVWVDL
jgi:hypothetical protein